MACRVSTKQIKGIKGKVVESVGNRNPQACHAHRVGMLKGRDASIFIFRLLLNKYLFIGIAFYCGYAQHFVNVEVGVEPVITFQMTRERRKKETAINSFSFFDVGNGIGFGISGLK